MVDLSSEVIRVCNAIHTKLGAEKAKMHLNTTYMTSLRKGTGVKQRNCEPLEWEDILTLPINTDALIQLPCQHIIHLLIELNKKRAGGYRMSKHVIKQEEITYKRDDKKNITTLEGMDNIEEANVNTKLIYHRKEYTRNFKAMEDRYKEWKNQGVKNREKKWKEYKSYTKKDKNAKGPFLEIPREPKMTFGLKGSPGAGKTLTGYAFFFNFLQQRELEEQKDKRTVVWVGLEKEKTGTIAVARPNTNEIIVFKKASIREAIIPFIEQMTSGNVLIVDGVKTNEQKKNEEHKDIVFTARSKLMLSYIIMSGSSDATASDDGGLSDEIMLSWDIDEAKQAWKVLKKNNLGFDYKYYYAGGSARHLFDTSKEDIIKSIKVALEKCSARIEFLLQLDMGQTSGAMDNMLVAPFKNPNYNASEPEDSPYVFRHMSAYVLNQLRSKFRDHNGADTLRLIKRALEKILANPVVTGFIWEACVDEQVWFQIKDAKERPTKPDSFKVFKSISSCDFSIRSRLTHKKSGSSVFENTLLTPATVQEGIWLAPEAWNNPVWDFIYLVGDKMYFIQCTLSARHEIKQDNIYNFVEKYNEKAESVGGYKSIAYIDVQIWQPANVQKCKISTTRLTRSSKVGPKIRGRRIAVKSIEDNPKDYSKYTSEEDLYTHVTIGIL